MRQPSNLEPVGTTIVDFVRDLARRRLEELQREADPSPWVTAELREIHRTLANLDRIARSSAA